jgi:predicted RNase H-like HicB family nuclease
MNYAIVIEKADNNFSAYVPDLPGCIATGKTRAETKRNIAEAIDFHIDGLLEDGLPIPKPSAAVGVVPIHKRGKRVMGFKGHKPKLRTAG